MRVDVVTAVVPAHTFAPGPPIDGPERSGPRRVACALPSGQGRRSVRSRSPARGPRSHAMCRHRHPPDVRWGPVCPLTPPPPTHTHHDTLGGGHATPRRSERRGAGGLAWPLPVLWSAAGGAYWPIATYCPSLGPPPSIGGGAPRPPTPSCPPSPSVAYSPRPTPPSLPSGGRANTAPGPTLIHCSVSGPHGGGRWPGASKWTPPYQRWGTRGDLLERGGGGGEGGRGEGGRGSRGEPPRRNVPGPQGTENSIAFGKAPRRGERDNLF